MTNTAELKGSSFTLSVLHLKDENYQQVEDMLIERKNLAPLFFDSAPLVVDISQLKTIPDFEKIKNFIEKAGMILVAVSGCKKPEVKEAAKKAGLAMMNPSKEKVIANTSHAQTKIIRTPIRSGQQIYAKDSDLIILNHVSAGAEIIADGNIHIYGSLRGRAIAGANGERSAYIFCQNLQPELVSIAGTYWLNEAIPVSYLGGSAKVSLIEDSLQIEPLAV